MKCKKCLTEIPIYSIYCPICGNKIKKRNNKVLIIPLTFCLLIGLFSIYYFFIKDINFNDKPDDYVDVPIATIESDDDGLKTWNKFDTSKVQILDNNTELGKNVKVDNLFFANYAQKSQFKYVYALLENNNDVPVNITVYLQFYDNEGYRIAKEQSTLVVLPNTKFAMKILVVNDKKNYSTVNLSYDVTNIKSYVYILPDVTFTSYRVNEEQFVSGRIEYSATNNNSEETSGAMVTIIYYKNGKVVYADYDYIGDINPGETKNYSIYDAYTGESNKSPKIDYDDYEIVLSSSYNTHDEY